MVQLTQQRTQLPERAATLATTAAALAKDLVVLQRRQQEAVATSRALCHRAQLHRARRQVVNRRRRGRDPGPLAWFALEGVLDDQVVRAVWTDGQLSCDRPLESQGPVAGRPGRRVRLRGGPVPLPGQPSDTPAAVLLTLIRACDLATTIECDLGAGDYQCRTAQKDCAATPGCPAPSELGPSRSRTSSS